jgi:uncharacterized protein (TIGR03084 family)
MIQEAIDFREESDALYELLEPLADEDFQKKTQFKEWTISDVLGHLHMWNWAAEKSLNDPDAFDKFITELFEEYTSGGSLRTYEPKWLDGLKDRELFEKWHSFCLEISKSFETADPDKRVKWAGPDMSVRASIGSRMMETWAHGQEIFDLLGVVRKNTDSIKNIAFLGIRTFGWTFKNRGVESPDTKAYVRLTAPSGEIWEWNDPSETCKVEGDAVEFCQVVTQVRNVADTSLEVVGEAAREWMSIAQCFAGPAEDPPKPGSRFTL